MPPRLPWKLWRGRIQPDSVKTVIVAQKSTGQMKMTRAFPFRLLRLRFWERRKNGRWWRFAIFYDIVRAPGASVCEIVMEPAVLPARLAKGFASTGLSGWFAVRRLILIH